MLPNILPYSFLPGFPHIKKKLILGFGEFLWTSDTKIEILKHELVGLPGGSVVKNLPANAGDMGSILDLGRSASCEELSPSPTSTEPML